MVIRSSRRYVSNIHKKVTDVQQNFLFWRFEGPVILNVPAMEQIIDGIVKTSWDLKETFFKMMLSNRIDAKVASNDRVL